MKILIYTGYHNPQLSKQVWLDKGIGGTEYCYIKLAEALYKQGHNVVVSGEVEEGINDGVHYIPLEQLKKHQSPMSYENEGVLRGYDHYDVVIAGQYINYYKELKRKKITYDKVIFWLHNEDGWYNWYRGNIMNIRDIKYAFDRIDKLVCVSELHASIMKAKLKALDYITPKSTTYIQSIDNAIDLDDWNNIRANRIKGRIVWSSSPDRGLKHILDNWSELKRDNPELTLHIACPPYASDWDKGLIDQDGVRWLGALSPKLLKEEQLRAEYWIYQSDYLETYCITGLEMMMAKVKCMTNGTGNLKNLFSGDRGMIINDDPATIGKMITRDKTDRTFARKWVKQTDKAYEWAKTQTWDVRVNEWLNLINSL